MEEPSNLRKLPHYKGMPIPVTVRVRKDGVPDFTDINWQKSQRLGLARACALCGRAMSKKEKVAFIGGTISVKNKLFQDGPMHQSCATYALQECPYLIGKKKSYRPGSIADPNASLEYPERIGLILTKKYAMGMNEYKNILYYAEDDPIEIIWRDEIPGLVEK